MYNYNNILYIIKTYKKMRTIPNNLQIAYYKLKKSRLIKDNDLDDDAIAYFESTLNNGLPNSQRQHRVNLFFYKKINS